MTYPNIEKKRLQTHQIYKKIEINLIKKCTLTKRQKKNNKNNNNYDKNENIIKFTSYNHN